MFVNENLNDLLKGKNIDEINKSFQEKYGFDYIALEDLETEFAKYDIQTASGYETKRQETIDMLVLQPWVIYSLSSVNAANLNTVATFLTKREAEDTANVLIKNMNPGYPNMYLRIEQSSTNKEYLTYTDALELLSKIKNNEPLRQNNIIIEQ